MVKIIWTRRSLKDLKSIFDYISLDSFYYATMFIKKIVFRIDQLLLFPESGRTVPEKNDTSLRELIEGNYRIFYRVNKSYITILRIHNSARKIK